MIMPNKNKSPCENCSMETRSCNYLGCVKWKKWFLQRWERINAYAKKHLPAYEERQKKGNENAENV